MKSSLRLAGALLLGLGASTVSVRGVYTQQPIVKTINQTASGLAGLSEVPFRVVADHAIVSVTVDGAGPFDFILDNGSETSILDPEIAQRLALPVAGHATLVSVSQQGTVSLVATKQIELGGMEASNLEVMVDPLREPKVSMPTIHGILGEDFLQRFDFLLDNREQKLIFERQPGALLTMMNGERLSLQRQTSPDGKPIYRQLVVHGRSLDLGGNDLAMHLDSGTNTAMLFSRFNGTRFLHQEGGMALVGSNGGRKGAQLMFVPSFMVGKVSLVDMPLAILDEWPNAPPGIDGVLPTWLFYRIYFNHSRGFVILNPSKAKHPHAVAAPVVAVSGD